MHEKENLSSSLFQIMFIGNFKSGAGSRYETL